MHLPKERKKTFSEYSPHGVERNAQFSCCTIVPGFLRFIRGYGFRCSPSSYSYCASFWVVLN